MKMNYEEYFIRYEFLMVSSSDDSLFRVHFEKQKKRGKSIVIIELICV